MMVVNMSYAEALAILQEAAKSHSQQELADAVEVSVATWQRIINGTRPLNLVDMAALHRVVGSDVAYRMMRAISPGVVLVPRGDPEPPKPYVEIPVYDVQVAAGAGRVADRLPPPLYNWTFSRDWMEANLRGVGQLVMVQVSGSSQEPELSDGDLVAVDLDQSRLREGLYVVRLDDLLVIKHIQVDGRTVRLMSRNPLYDPVEIDLHEPGIGERFEVVGRAVWASKML